MLGGLVGDVTIGGLVVGTLGRLQLVNGLALVGGGGGGGELGGN